MIDRFVADGVKQVLGREQRKANMGAIKDMPLIGKFEAYQFLKAEAAKAEDSGLRALAEHFHRSWEKDKLGSHTFSDMEQLKKFYEVNYPKSAAREVLANALIKHAMLDRLPLLQLKEEASRILIDARWNPFAVRDLYNDRMKLYGSGSLQDKACRDFVRMQLNAALAQTRLGRKLIARGGNLVDDRAFDVDTVHPLVKAGKGMGWKQAVRGIGRLEDWQAGQALDRGFTRKGLRRVLNQVGSIGDALGVQKVAGGDEGPGGEGGEWSPEDIAADMKSDVSKVSMEGDTTTIHFKSDSLPALGHQDPNYISFDTDTGEIVDYWTTNSKNSDYLKYFRDISDGDYVKDILEALYDMVQGGEVVEPSPKKKTKKKKGAADTREMYTDPPKSQVELDEEIPFDEAGVDNEGYAGDVADTRPVSARMRRLLRQAMSKKDYIAIGKALMDTHASEETVNAIADVFAADNMAFNRERFVNYVLHGYGPGGKAHERAAGVVGDAMKRRAAEFALMGDFDDIRFAVNWMDQESTPEDTDKAIAHWIKEYGWEGNREDLIVSSLRDFYGGIEDRVYSEVPETWAMYVNIESVIHDMVLNSEIVIIQTETGYIVLEGIN